MNLFLQDPDLFSEDIGETYCPWCGCAAADDNATHDLSSPLLAGPDTGHEIKYLDWRQSDATRRITIKVLHSKLFINIDTSTLGLTFMIFVVTVIFSSISLLTIWWEMLRIFLKVSLKSLSYFVVRNRKNLKVLIFAATMLYEIMTGVKVTM